MSERLLTLPQAAEQLACSLATIKRRIHARQLPVFRDGRLIRIRQQDLDHYIHQHTTHAADTRTEKPARNATSGALPPRKKLFDLPDPLT